MCVQAFIVVILLVSNLWETYAQCNSVIVSVDPAAVQQFYGFDFAVAVGKGLYTNNERVTINGMLDTFSAVSVVNWLDLKATGVAGLYVPPTTSATITLVSTSANDAAAGTGCRTVLIEGLDSSGAAASATVTMNGVAATAATATSFSFVNRMTCATVGTGLVNAGVISLGAGPGVAATRPVIGLTNSAFTAFGVSRSNGAAYRVPNGKTFLLMGLEADTYRAATTAGTFSSIIWIKYSLTPTGPAIMFERISLDVDAQMTYSDTFSIPALTLPAGATIWAEGMVESTVQPLMITLTGVLYS